jgi:(p)ppGpp synthase/HD superfamily hydrolase
MTQEQMLKLKEIHLAPYMMLATALIGKSREAGGNMFRHQLDTMTILIDYGYIDSLLLKASIIHDLVEDIPDYSRNLILQTDYEAAQVYQLVMEVTRDRAEPKSAFLTRILEQGSRQAKVLKCADRISNMISLGYVNRAGFIKRYSDETVRYIYPIAEQVDQDMRRELGDLVESRSRLYDRLEGGRLEGGHFENGGGNRAESW